jgi:voltage-gated potassium channel
MPMYKVVEPELGRASYEHWRRVVARALLVVAGAILACAGGLVALDARDVPLRQKLLDGVWNAGNTITTLGDLTDLADAQRLFMVSTMVALAAAGTYALTSLPGIISGDSFAAFRENRRTERMITALKGHVILVGFGPIGLAVAKAVRAQGSPIVVIESDPEASARAAQDGYLVVQGMANETETLEAANIRDAQGIVVTIDEVDQKLSIALQSRELNPEIHLVAMAHSEKSRRWILRAGASDVVMVDQLVGEALVGSFRARSTKAPAPPTA